MDGDRQIEQAVLQELRWDPRVEVRRIGVEVANGRVTLLGTVPSPDQRALAEDAVRRVDGVVTVVNQLYVVSPAAELRPDGVICQAVRHTLDWDEGLPGQQLQVTVVGGVVTLTGQVGYAHQRDAAERAVRRLRGVRAVVNDLSVTAPRASDDTIQQMIHAALERRGQRGGRGVQVAVNDGVATLVGEVPSWGERQAVVAAARLTVGVRAIDDRLRVVAAANVPA
jgi:osmotically-inducible protein OsmY